MNKFITGAIVAGVIVIGGLIFTIGGTSRVGVGNVGIVKHMDGQVTELPQGWHWTGWGVSVQDYPTYMQSLILSSDKKEGGDSNGQWEVGTSDQQELPVNTSLTWKINTKDASNIYQTVGGKDISYISDRIVQPTLKNIANRITHDYSWNDIKGDKQGEVTDKIQAELKIELAKVGIETGNFGFTYVGTPQGMAQSQQTLASSELKVKQAQAVQAQAKIENETKILNAQADSQAKLIKAQGEAHANQVLAKSITPELIQYNQAQKWDGKLPTTSLGGNVTAMFPVRK